MSVHHMSTKKSKLNKYPSSQVVLDDCKGHEMFPRILQFEYTGNGQTVPKDIVSVRFHPSVGVVDNDAFYNCKRLIEVVLNVGLREIGNSALPSKESRAFANCSSLQKIELPSTVTKIGTFAFYGCISLTEVVLNEGLVEIAGTAFGGCSALQSITIPSTVKKIGSAAFNNCTNLREIVLNDGLKKIGSSLFVSCPSLTSITIPSTVDEIELWTFCYCNNLREVVLNEGLKAIHSHAFQDCNSLERIVIPSSVIEIKELAFEDCNSLQEVVIHNLEVQIDFAAFGGCTSLERFSFPRFYTRLDNVIQSGHRDIEAKLDDIPAVEWRGGELIIPIVRREIEHWEIGMVEVTGFNNEKLDKVVRLIRHYEIKEAATLFELALWRARIDQADDTDDINRDAYRIEVPGPVKDAILQYLD